MLYPVKHFYDDELNALFKNSDEYDDRYDEFKIEDENADNEDLHEMLFKERE